MKTSIYRSARFRRLGRQARISGSQALALSTILTNAVRIISTMCLTRLLSPEVYGISGLIVSVFLVLGLLSDAGFQAYVVRHQESDDPDFLSAVWTIHAARGIALTVIAIILAWPVSLLLAQRALAAPLAVAAFIFTIEGQASLHQFRALRTGGVQRFAALNLAFGISQTVMGIIFAYFFPNIWAIVGSMLFGSTVRVWLSYRLFEGDRHRIRVDRRVASDLWRFSRMIAASSALTLVITQVDKLAMGRIMPLSQFGIYVIAATLAAAPTTFGYNYAATIVYPAAAAAWRDGESLVETYYRCWGRFFYLYALGGGLLIGGADLLVRLLYDPRYLPAALYLSILAIGTTMTMITQSMQELLVARGHTRATLEMNVVRLVWLVLGGAVALVRADPLLFVLTIGLKEVPAYCYAAWRMHRLSLICWRRELSAGLTIAAGVAAGGAVSYLGLLLAPNL